MKRIVKTFDQYNKLNEHLGDTDDALINDIIEILDAEELDFNYSPMFIDNFIADHALQDRDSDTIAAAITDWVKQTIHFDGGEDSSLDILVLIVYCKEGTITFVELMDWGQAKADHHGYEDAIETGEADAIYVLDVVKTAGNLGNFHAGGTPLDFEECEIITTFFDDNGKLGQSIKPQNR